MRFNYELSFADYTAAQALHSKRSVIRYLSHILGYYVFPVFGICFLVVVLFPTKPIHSTLKTNWVAIVCGAYLICCPFILRLAARSRYKRMKGGGACEIELDETSIRTQGLHTKSEIEWKAVQSLAEDRKSFLLYLAPARFIVIPKRACASEQVEELHTLLDRQVTPDSKEPADVG